MISSADFRFDFLEELSPAIEQVTAQALSRDRQAFSHRGADLRFAAERDLFFGAVNSAGLYSAYQRARTASAAIPANLPNRWEWHIARALCAPYEEARRLTYKREADLTDTARHLLHRAATTAGRAARQPHRIGTMQRGERPDARAGGVWFLVHQWKFVSYLKPIADALAAEGLPCLWLPSQPTVARRLEREGWPYAPLHQLADETYGSAGLRHFWLPPCRSYAYLLAQFDALWQLCARGQPGCLVVAEGNAPADEVVSQVGRRLGIPVACIQQGWASVPHSGFRNWSFAAALMWGQGFADLLQPVNPGQRFTITGSHILDTPGPPGCSRQELNAGRPVVTFFLQAPTAYIGREHWTDFIELIGATAACYPTMRLRVREHPSYPLAAHERGHLGRFPNVAFVPPATHSLRQVLSTTSVSVSICSTTILESAAFLVPPLVYNRTSMPRYSPDVDKFGAGIEVHDRAGAMAMLERMVNDRAFRLSFRPRLLSFRERYFHHFDGQSLARIVANVERLVGHGCPVQIDP